MSEAAIKLRDHFDGAEPVTLTPGSGGFYPLTGLLEPGNVGLPPITPDLFPGLVKRWDRRSVRVRSGQRQSFSLATLGRGSGRVRWSGLSKARRTTLRAWIDGTARTDKAFQIEPDGTGTGVVSVRAVSWTDTHVGKGCWMIEAEVEEVFV